ncbi:MAG TPA: MazG-like family protein [Thermomicrobiales bacterium]|nr:MazG-like family protein [Thermomicrobiales bacterium]
MRERIYADIDVERERQEARFGSQYHAWPTWSTILTEECGEVAEACLMTHWGSDADLPHLREELIQVAAVAVQMVEKLDSGDFPPSVTRTDDSGSALP